MKFIDIMVLFIDGLCSNVATVTFCNILESYGRQQSLSDRPHLDQQSKIPTIQRKALYSLDHRRTLCGPLGRSLCQARWGFALPGHPRPLHNYNRLEGVHLSTHNLVSTSSLLGSMKRQNPAWSRGTLHFGIIFLFWNAVDVTLVWSNVHLLFTNRAFAATISVLDGDAWTFDNPLNGCPALFVQFTMSTTRWRGADIRGLHCKWVIHFEGLIRIELVGCWNCLVVPIPLQIHSR